MTTTKNLLSHKNLHYGVGKNRVLVGLKKDGGYASNVSGLFLEAKRLATAALLRFADGSREAFHSHAFNCVSLVVGPGYLREVFYDGREVLHKPWKVLVTRREDLHKVYSHGTTYVLTLRGPWADRWVDVENGNITTLTHGRRTA